MLISVGGQTLAERAPEAAALEPAVMMPAQTEGSNRDRSWMVRPNEEKSFFRSFDFADETGSPG